MPKPKAAPSTPSPDPKVLEITYSYKSAVLTFIGAVLGTAATLVAALFTGYAGWWKSSRDVDLKMVDTALQILATEKGSDQVSPARRFAILTLQQHSGVKMDEAFWNAWMISPRLLPYPPNARPIASLTKSELQYEAQYQSTAMLVYGNWKLATKPTCTVTFSQAVFLEPDSVSLSDDCKATPVASAWDFSISPGKVDLLSKGFKNLLELSLVDNDKLKGSSAQGEPVTLEKITN